MSQWFEGDVPRGERYDDRFSDLEARGVYLHGEADLIDSYGPASVLDAGCGTGRLAIELARRGKDVVGVDVDDDMLDVARRKAPQIPWVHADLADPHLELHRQFDVAVMAGNVLIFVTPGSEGDVIANVVRHVVPGGLVIAGYSLRPHGFGIAAHDALASDVGLVLEDRWSTWDRKAFKSESDYAVSVHRRVTEVR